MYLIVSKVCDKCHTDKHDDILHLPVMNFSDGTVRKVLKLLLKYKLSPEGTIVTGELNGLNMIVVFRAQYKF